MNRFFKGISTAVIVIGSYVGMGATGVAKADGLRFAIYSPTENTCLDVKDYSTSPGAIVQTYQCTGTTNQLWNAEIIGYSPDGTESMRLINVGSGLCLDLVYQGTNPGIGVLQAPCNNSGTQAWKVPSPSSAAGRQIVINGAVYTYVDSYAAIHRNLINQATGLCLQPGGAGQQVTQQACGAATTWRVPVF
ncbi:RICIN domain-containing protein [Luteibacter sp. PPL552]